MLAALVLVAGAALLGSDGFTWVRYAVSILALVVAVFAWQAGQWWWLLALVPIAVAWNPVFPFDFAGPVWQALQFLAALLFVAAGVLIKVRNPDQQRRR